MIVIGIAQLIFGWLLLTSNIVLLWYTVEYKKQINEYAKRNVFVALYALAIMISSCFGGMILIMSAFR